MVTESKYQVKKVRPVQLDLLPKNTDFKTVTDQVQFPEFIPESGALSVDVLESAFLIAQVEKVKATKHLLAFSPGGGGAGDCGWGGLVIHAAQHYGVDALGITLSRPQAKLANERIAAAGLTDRCQVELLDYREVDEPESMPVVGKKESR